jgi:glycerophosphoryl diester phosphodiesterase
MYSKSMIIACRGDRENAPENTIPAFESAISRGAEGVELDVHFTKDKEEKGSLVSIRSPS